MANFLTGLIAVTTLVQFVSGGHSLALSIEKVGLIKSEVRDGEYWRLLTGCLVHGGILHVFFNGSALRGFGENVEALGGRWALPFVLLLSMLSGSLFSLFINPLVDSVGASGGILGLVGYLLIFAWKQKQILPPGFGKNLLFNLGIVVVMGIVMYRMIDNWAHLGGFLMGAVIGLVLIPSDLRRLLSGEAVWIQMAGKASFGALILTSCFAIFKMLQS